MTLRRACSTVLAVCLMALGCTGSRSPNEPPAASLVQTRPLNLLATENAGRETPLFEQLSSSQTGIEFRHYWQPRDAYEEALLKTGFTGGGIALGDYDNDGYCDVFFTRPFGGARLYRNLGGFRFQDVTRLAELYDPGAWTSGATFVDVNNDGYLDLYVCTYATGNRMWLNQRDGTFRDVARDCGLSFAGASIKMIFADYDLDGDLDAYLVTNRLEPRQGVNIRYLGGPGRYTVADEHGELAGIINLPGGEQKFTKAGQFDHLYRNELVESGQLRFTDLTARAGIEGNYHGLDAIWWDANADGYPDLYVANDFTDPDQLYLNSGNGTFRDVTGSWLPHTPWFTMGCAAGDFNNDGRPDLIATDMAGTTHYREKMAMGSMDAMAWFLDTAEPRQYMRNALFIGSGADRFLEAAHMAGVASSDWTWSVKVADLDNDGREDLFITNGFTRDYLNSDFNESLRARGRESDSLAWYEAPELRERNIAFRNSGELHFTSIGAPWGVDELGISFGAALGDLDNDGDLDLVVSNFDAAPSVYRNREGSGHRVKIRLRGHKSNRFGLGSLVTLTTSHGQQMRWLGSGGGFLSSDEPCVYFGLADQTRIRQLTIDWPSGAVQTLTDVHADQLMIVAEPGLGRNQRGSFASGRHASTVGQQTLYRPTPLLDELRHHETQYDDFQAQPLLPFKLSQLGPGMAWGDVDGDGDEDLYMGGAAGQPGQLWLREGPERFVRANVPAFEADAAAEDMGCLLFDADGDGDRDLYVVSGGVECAADSSLLEDRLYLNQGAGAHFVQSTDALPELRDSGSVVAAADYDRDGDLDLFVGGRLVPGNYPTSPNSRLLENEGGRFRDVTNEIAPHLLRVGMVTCALWTDIDDDGRIDLLLGLDYGPIHVFRNDGARLVPFTHQAGLGELKGWWNGLDCADFDRDGDLDYVATNLGRNTKYHPTHDKPQYVFYGDFDGSGRRQIVEAKPGDRGLLPVRGRSCSTNAMPFLRQKFSSFHTFASATLEDIYTQTCLDQALQLEVTTADSGILQNDGSGHFTFHPLPLLAQIAPGFGVAFLEANGDAYPDLVIAQNFFSPQRETGRMDGGVSLLLQGTAEGAFEAMWPDYSGVVIPGDAAGVAVVDLNEDAWPDLVFTVNDGAVHCFMHRGPFSAPVPTPLTVRITGSAGNPDAIGARVRLITRSGRQQVAEVASTRGYLTGPPTELRLGVDHDDPPVELEVRWPDGGLRRVKIVGTTGRMNISPATPSL